MKSFLIKAEIKFKQTKLRITWALQDAYMTYKYNRIISKLK